MQIAQNGVRAVQLSVLKFEGTGCIVQQNLLVRVERVFVCRFGVFLVQIRHSFGQILHSFRRRFGCSFGKRKKRE